MGNTNAQRGRKETAMKKYEKVACGGMDVHYKFSNVTFRDAKGKIVRRERLDHRDRRKLIERLSLWPQKVPIVLEASFGWGWLSDLMIELGLDPRLSNCAKVEQMRKARGWAKTNKKDADLLSLLPREEEEWWRVWLAPPEVRDRREWTRYRRNLVIVQTQTKSRIHAIFHRHGIFHEFSDLFGAHGRHFLRMLCRDGCPLLPPGSLGALRGQVMLLEHVRAQLAGVERVLRGQIKHSRLAQVLKTVPGFGVILVDVLVAEIGQMERFGGQKHLAAYSLLAPIAADSGEEDRTRSPMGRHLGHRGNLTLKWAFIEAAHGAVASGGKWRAMHDRYTDGGKKNRNRGYIKVARELVKVVCAVWKSGKPYQEGGVPRPGSEKARSRRRDRKSRSGTGQLCNRMVQV